MTRLANRLVVFLLGCTFAANQALAARLTGSFTTLAPGLEIAEGAATFGDAEVPLTLVRVDPARYGVRVATPADLAPPEPSAAAGGGTLREYFQRLGAAAVLAGGLVASFEPLKPLGLVVSDGRVVSPPHPTWASSGLFCTGPEGASIRPFDPSATPTGEGIDCLQSGPLLVGPDGVVPGDRLRRSVGIDYARDFVEGRHRRTFVALDRRGRVLLGVTGPLDLPRLTEVLAAADPETLDIAAALNLTGAWTAGLLVRAGEGEVEVRAGDPDGVALPTAIAVLPPDAPGPSRDAVGRPNLGG